MNYCHKHVNHFKRVSFTTDMSIAAVLAWCSTCTLCAIKLLCSGQQLNKLSVILS